MMPVTRASEALPVPDADAQAASQALAARIGLEIDRNGGWISFTRYMELSLYEPGLGYYAGGATRFGAMGDFVTAPALGPLFAQTLSRSLTGILRECAPNVLEFGAGTGALAGDLLAELSRLGVNVERYAILEPSAALAAQQRDEIARRVPSMLGRVEWLERLPDAFRGAMIANEVLDAMPVHVLGWTGAGIVECGVTREGAGFAWAERSASGDTLAAARALQQTHAIAAPYRSELGLAAQAWMRSVAGTLEAGALFIIDYGFPAQEFFHPQRSGGTLMCHYRHYAHVDPFLHPGLQDITAHVDFSAIAEQAVDAGLDILGYATQAGFLIDAGVTDILAASDPRDVVRYAPLAAAAQTLLSPAEMGELFKVLAVGRGVSIPIRGFERADRSGRL